MAMTKAGLVEIICEKTGFTRHDSVECLEQVFAIMKETLEKGEKIKISGFGNFVVRQKRSRKGRNPKTGEEIEISARRVLTFKPSYLLRKIVNKETSSSAQFGVPEDSSNEIKNP